MMVLRQDATEILSSEIRKAASRSTPDGRQYVAALDTLSPKCKVFRKIVSENFTLGKSDPGELAVTDCKTVGNTWHIICMYNYL